MAFRIKRTKILVSPTTQQEIDEKKDQSKSKYETTYSSKYTSKSKTTEPCQEKTKRNISYNGFSINKDGVYNLDDY